ncbi:MAG: RluA family pseudouridine synthase [Alphaproteobacteria bacterium]|nr:RluA family pseudouridine synthase [Alphaproteobacteria bacterium]
MSRVQHIEVIPDEDGQRLDRFLKKHLEGTPFSLLQKLMRKGQIRVDSKRVKPDTRLQSGQNVRIPPLEDKKPAHKPKLSEKDRDFIRSLVIYDEGGIIALNKPAGIATQGGSKVTRHIDGMLDALKDKEAVRPRLVHRLDKDTSGVLLLARSASMARELGKIFQGRNIKKIYWALCAPAPEINSGEIRAPIRKIKNSSGQEKMCIDPEEGQNATTYFDVLERAHKQAAFVAFWPRTGRTHQIRIHAAHMGFGVIGDPKYFSKNDQAHDPNQPNIDLGGINISKRLHLHAHEVEFIHPKNSKMVTITAPLPGALIKSWKNFGFSTTIRDDIFQDVK